MASSEPNMALAASIGHKSLLQLGVGLADIALLIQWGKKFGNFLKASDNEADLVNALDEPAEVLLPRRNLIDRGHMKTRWSHISFTYQGVIVASNGKNLKVPQDLTEFGWLMVALISGLDLCLDKDRVLQLIVDVMAAVLGRENEVEESLRIVLPTNVESWRQVGKVRKINLLLRQQYIKARQKRGETDVVPELNEAEEVEMRQFLIWLMKEKHDHHFRAISLDVYALADGIQSVGVHLKIDGPRTFDTEPIVEYCSTSGSSTLPQLSSRQPRSRAVQVSYPLGKPKAMIQSVPASRHVLNEMEFFWDLGSKAGEYFHLVPQSETPFSYESDVFYSLDGEDFAKHRISTWTRNLADRAFPTLANHDAGHVLQGVEKLIERMDDSLASWVHQHTEPNYLENIDAASESKEQREAMLKYEALVFGFYFRLFNPLVCLDLVDSSTYCQGLWGYGNYTFLAMCISLNNIFRRSGKISRSHILYMLSSMFNGRQKRLSSTIRTGLLGILGSISVVSLPLLRTVDTPNEISQFVIVDLPIIDLAAADTDGELYAGSGGGVSFIDREGQQEDIAPRKPTKSWSIHAKMGVSVRGGLDGVVMAAKCSGRLVGWFNPLAADVAFLSTAYLAFNGKQAPNDYDTACIRGLQIVDEDWQSGKLPTQVGVDEACFRVVHSWGCPPLRYAATGFFAALGEEVAISTGNFDMAFRRMKPHSSGVIVT